MTRDAPRSGWNLGLALAIAGFLALVMVIIIAIGVRVFDAFDTGTEILIGALVFLLFAGINGAVIYYLNAMPEKGPSDGGS